MDEMKKIDPNEIAIRELIESELIDNPLLRRELERLLFNMVKTPGLKVVKITLTGSDLRWTNHAHVNFTIEGKDSRHQDVYFSGEHMVEAAELLQRKW